MTAFGTQVGSDEDGSDEDDSDLTAVGQTPPAGLDARAVHLPRPNRGTCGQSAEGAKAKRAAKGRVPRDGSRVMQR